jgi:hypothetical protein
METAWSRKDFSGPGDELEKKAPQKNKEELTGDLVLAKSCCFIYDAMIS